MTGSLSALVVAALAFVVSHIGLSAPGLRRPLIDRFGAAGFRAGYALLALALLAWMSLAYGRAPVVDWWQPPVWARHLSLTLMPLATILVVAGLTTPNPSLAGAAPGMAAAGPQGVLKITRHPLMWGLALWGMAHLLATGDAAGSVFFGALTLLALVGSLTQDRRKAADLGDAWAAYAAATSWLPFRAMLAGRTRLTIGELGWWRLAGGLALYLLLLWLHPWLFGVDPLAV
jgi:uncharacterized membrane protein